MTHDNVTDIVERGYAAAENGEPDRPNLRKFSEGWNVYHDGKYWDEIAAQIGAKIYGFTFRNSATFIFPNGDLLESSKGLLTAIATLRKQLENAREALVNHNCGTPGCLCHECCREADAREVLKGAKP